MLTFGKSHLLPCVQHRRELQETHLDATVLHTDCDCIGGWPGTDTLCDSEWMRLTDSLLWSLARAADLLQADHDRVIPTHQEFT